MVALDVVRVVALLRVVDVVRVVVLQLVVDVVALRRSVPLPDQQRMLRRLVFYTKGEFTDIAHKDDCNPASFVEYAYAAKTTQPNVPINVQEAMKMSDADSGVKQRKRRPRACKISISTSSFPGQQLLQAKRALAPRFLK